MGTTGAPWNIPYVEPADLVRAYPAADEAQALAIAAGLDSASTLQQVQQVTTTTDFTTTSTSFVDLTGVTVTVVPSDAANRIVMWFTCNYSLGGGATHSAFFNLRRDTTNIFETVELQAQGNAGRPLTMSVAFDESAGSTASRTYSLQTRVSSNNITVLNSSLIVMEYAT